MRLIDFIKERILFIIISIVILPFSSILLSALSVDLYAIVFIFILNSIGILIFHLYDYLNKKNKRKRNINLLSKIFK